MQFRSSRFGLVEAEEDKVLSFPLGLPGFEHLRRFVLLPGPEGSVFGWLHSIDSESTAFLVTDPFFFFADYYVDIPEQDTKELELEASADALVLVIVSVPEGNVARATVNLLAPLVINTEKRLARQVILHSSPFTTNHPLFQPVAPGAAKEAVVCSY